MTDEQVPEEPQDAPAAERVDNMEPAEIKPAKGSVAEYLQKATESTASFKETAIVAPVVDLDWSEMGRIIATYSRPGSSSKPVRRRDAGGGSGSLGYNPNPGVPLD